jgi:HAE1 family hydrophobic/amphiphilic exporter-1
MSLPAFSVRQAVLVNVLFFVCLLGGLAAYTRIPLEFFQDINLNEAFITTVWPGSSAEEVERLITQKLEEELLTVVDIDEMHSVSSAGLSSIGIDFDEYLDEVDYEAALNDVRAAIDRVTDLPADVEESELTEGKFSEVIPVVMVAVVDSGGIGRLALREVARDVKSRAKYLPGVNRIEIRGDQERELLVRVDRDAAARFGLTVAGVAERIRRQNLNLPAGTFETPTGEQTLRAQGDYKSVAEVLATVVAENPGGTYVRLAEIARVEEGLEKAVFRTRYNGRPALFVTITKKSDADVISLVDAVDAWIADQRPRLPEGVEIYKTFDTAAFVSHRMGILAENLLAGVIFVMAILWFTIGFRNATLTVIAIPFSFLSAMILFPVFGITLNATTIIGMLLVSGMLVDDAIIVLENIYARIERGEPLREAVVHGAEEVLWPVVAAVATTCAAFGPLLLIGGTAGKFAEILPKAVIVCLIASLFECLVILPAHYIDFGSRRHDGESRKAADRSFATRFRLRVDGGLAWLRDGYSRALDVVLAHRFSFGALFVSVFLLAFAGSRHLRVDLFPSEFDTFNVLLEGPADASLDQSDGVVLAYERIVDESLKNGEIRDYSTTVGLSVDTTYDRLIGTNYAMTVLTMATTEETTRAPEEVLFRMQERIDAYAREHPQGIMDLRAQAEHDGPPVGPPVEVRLQSDDYALGKAVAGEMRAFMETIPGIYNIEDNLKVGAPEVRLLVDDERSARHGLGFEDLAMALRGANDGLIASSFRDPTRNEDVDIRVRLDDRYRRDLQDLLGAEVRTPANYLVKLRDVADVEVTRGYRAYHRYDGKRTVTVYGQVDDKRETSISANQKIQARFVDLESRYPQLDVRYGGEYAETTEVFADLFRAFPVALVAIYMILAALFRSYLQPVVVVTSVPFAFVGIIVGVALLGYSVSFVLLYAAIGLTGVVVNDSLVMVDFINRARAQGMDLLEAVRQSGARRFRPILLTTLTTVVAMAGTLFAVPLAYTSLIVGQRRLTDFLRARRGELPQAVATSTEERPPRFASGG